MLIEEVLLLRYGEKLGFNRFSHSFLTRLIVDYISELKPSSNSSKNFPEANVFRLRVSQNT